MVNNVVPISTLRSLFQGRSKGYSVMRAQNWIICQYVAAFIHDTSTEIMP